MRPKKFSSSLRSHLAARLVEDGITLFMVIFSAFPTPSSSWGTTGGI